MYFIESTLTLKCTKLCFLLNKLFRSYNRKRDGQSVKCNVRQNGVLRYIKNISRLKITFKN